MCYLRIAVSYRLYWICYLGHRRLRRLYVVFEAALWTAVREVFPRVYARLCLSLGTKYTEENTEHRATAGLYGRLRDTEILS